MIGRHRLAVCAIAVTCATQVGCSFIFIDRVPANHQRLSAFSCTSGVAAPVLDTIWAGLNGTGALVALSQSDRDYAGRSVSREGTIGIGLAWLAVSGASAIYGYSNTQRCREATADLQTRIARQPPSPVDTTPLAIPASTNGGCQKDTDCKGTRICAAGVCIEPAPAR